MLCRKSISLSKISGSIISSYLIPSLKSKIVRESEMIKVSKMSRKSEKENKQWFEVPFEEMNPDQKNQCREGFLKKLADFLFDHKCLLREALKTKIFNKVVNGAEYHMISHRHFIRLIKRAGFSLSNNDEMCIKDLLTPILKGYLDIIHLENVLKEIGIEYELPPIHKHLDYSKLDPYSIRLFNKINARIEETGAENIVSFLGRENIEYIEVVTKNQSKQTIEVVSNVKFRTILREKAVINYGIEIDEDFLTFVALDDHT